MDVIGLQLNGFARNRFTVYDSRNKSRFRTLYPFSVLSIAAKASILITYLLFYVVMVYDRLAI